MARSPALREALTVAAAAAAGWVALVVVLFELVPVGPARPAHAVSTVAAHRPVPAHAWHGAAQVYDELDRRAVRLTADERARVARAILDEAAQAGIAPLLVLAVIHVESRFDPRAVSPVGAVGLMQLMVPTFREALGDAPRVDPFDPVANVRAGVRYLGRLVGSFSSVELALVAYNAGPGAVRRHLETGGVPERLRAYPRDVLRQAVLLWPATPVVATPSSRAAARPVLAATHAPPAPAPLRPGALAVREAPLPVQVGVVGGAAAEPPRLAAAHVGACVPLQLGLPMSRGRERTGPLAARTAILA